ncbi:MAG TPA: polysaccharide biosynthesis/export family protein [Terriglobales bacterium]|nr:polysaccharide biosynthesis/export family protein [Terriglobales bacterium]
MRLTWRAMTAALILVSGIAFAQDTPATTAAPDNAIARSTSPAGPEYVIGPQDVLHIAVWKETDLTATLPVRPDGKISLPLLNDVQASGLTPKQLADSVTDKLKKYIADPRVTVVVTEINSKRIYIVGEVIHAGATPMLPNMTVLQALSSAGLNQFAKTKGIYLLRTENGKQTKMPVNYKKIVKGEQIDQNYLLQPGDTIVVP